MNREKLGKSLYDWCDAYVNVCSRVDDKICEAVKDPKSIRVPRINLKGVMGSGINKIKEYVRGEEFLGTAVYYYLGIREMEKEGKRNGRERYSGEENLAGEFGGRGDFGDSIEDFGPRGDN